MANNIIEKIISLRSIIAYLGEKNQFNWWDTSFLNPTGFKFLEYNFPRTFHKAAYNSTCQAAKLFHDERIGKGRVIHLFRLPLDVEQNIEKQLNETNFDMMNILITDKGTALSNLSIFGKQSQDNTEGPINIDTFPIMSVKGLEAVASIYLMAFDKNKFSFPYQIVEG